MAKKLPKGLLEFEATLHGLEFTGELLKRLLDLPEHAFHEKIAQFEQAMKAVADAETFAAHTRNVAREIAMKIWKTAKKEWTIPELVKATGYDDQ